MTYTGATNAEEFRKALDSLFDNENRIKAWLLSFSDWKEADEAFRAYVAEGCGIVG